MISQTTEYALRAVAYLASKAMAASTGPASPQPTVCRTVQEIAADSGMPAEYLSKVMHELTRAGLVKSQRGPAGGFRLAGDPAQTTVLSVVQAVSPLSRIHHCPLGREDHSVQLCPLHQLLDDAIAGVEKVFREATIADLLKPTLVGGSLCDQSAPRRGARRSGVRLSIDRSRSVGKPHAPNSIDRESSNE